MTTQASLSPPPDEAPLRLRSAETETRIPALTGIRGVAVLMVMTLHFLPEAALPHYAWLRRVFQMTFGGGVDLFFVLSGFLITGILLDTQGQAHYFRNFFARRVLRIFPLYYGTLAVVFGLLPGLGVLGGPGFEPVQAQSPWHWAYLGNVAWYLHPLAFDASPIDLRHFWSLAVEEHFYLIWPFVVAACTPRMLRRVCVAMLVASLGLRLAWTAMAGDHYLFIFLTPCHLDGLAAGAFLAALTREVNWRRWIPAAKAVIAVLFVALGGVIVGLRGHGTLGHSVGLTFFSLLLAGGMFLVLGAPQRSLAPKVLGTGFFQFFGNYSYGLYVIHGLLLPVLDRWVPLEPLASAMGSQALGGIAVVAIKTLMVIPMALISWGVYENPVLKLKRYFH